MPDPQIHEPMPAASRINSRGKAWLCNRADALRSHKIKPVFDAVIADWVVEVPQAHAIWHSYHVALMHLRPLRGQPPADLYVPDATHELCVFAMDPGQPRAPAVTGTGFANDRLIAGTFVAQLTSPTDAAATARIAAWKGAEAARAAGLDQPLTQGSVVASDAFFPFADGLQAAIAAGATAVIQPGGSMRDNEVVAAADAAGIAMVLTGMRHFRH